LTALCRDRKAAGPQCKITDALRISLKETARSGFFCRSFDASFVQVVPEPDAVGVPRVGRSSGLGGHVAAAPAAAGWQRAHKEFDWQFTSKIDVGDIGRYERLRNRLGRGRAGVSHPVAVSAELNIRVGPNFSTK
jgi:hypothetical protein